MRHFCLWIFLKSNLLPSFVGRRSHWANRGGIPQFLAYISNCHRIFLFTLVWLDSNLFLRRSFEFLTRTCCYLIQSGWTRSIYLPFLRPYRSLGVGSTHLTPLRYRILRKRSYRLLDRQGSSNLTWNPIGHFHQFRPWLTPPWPLHFKDLLVLL